MVVVFERLSGQGNDRTGEAGSFPGRNERGGRGLCVQSGSGREGKDGVDFYFLLVSLEEAAKNDWLPLRENPLDRVRPRWGVLDFFLYTCCRCVLPIEWPLTLKVGSKSRERSSFSTTPIECARK